MNSAVKHAKKMPAPFLWSQVEEDVLMEEKAEKFKAVHAKHLKQTKAARQAKRGEQEAATKRKRVDRMKVCFRIAGCDCVRGRMPWMFRITCCVVQAAADKAQKVSDKK